MATSGGQSGSPILFKDEGEWVVIGIHNKGRKYQTEKMVNKGVFFSKYNKGIIEFFIKELTQPNLKTYSNYINNA